MRLFDTIILTLLLAGCASRSQLPPPPRPVPRPIDDGSGHAVHVLDAVDGADGTAWVATNGSGLWRLAVDAVDWQRVGEGALPEHLTAVAVNESGVWVGSRDGRVSMTPDSGETWRHFDFGAVPVIPGGIVARERMVAVATPRGLRLTTNGGRTWSCLVGTTASLSPLPACASGARVLPNDYVLALRIDARGDIWIGHAQGAAVSRDAGRSWTELDQRAGLPAARVRALATNAGVVWLATESSLFMGDAKRASFNPAAYEILGVANTAQLPGRPRALIESPRGGWPAIAYYNGLLAPAPGGEPKYRTYFADDAWTVLWWRRPLSPFTGERTGIRTYLSAPNARRCASHDEACNGWRASRGGFPQRAAFTRGVLRRPVGHDGGTPYIDLTRPFGVRGNGAVRFATPAGSPVASARPGSVVRVDTDAIGHVITIAHDTIDGLRLWTEYRGIAAPEVQPGARVTDRTRLGAVADRGWSMPGLDFAVLAAPDSAGLHDARPVNPAHYLQGIDGTGLLEVRVENAAGDPARAEVHGISFYYPSELTQRVIPAYDGSVTTLADPREGLLVTDVPPGTHVLTATIDGVVVRAVAEIRTHHITRVVLRP